MEKKVTIRLKSLTDGEIESKFQWPKKLKRNLQCGVGRKTFVWDIQRNGQL